MQLKIVHLREEFKGYQKIKDKVGNNVEILLCIKYLQLQETETEAHFTLDVVIMEKNEPSQTASPS